MQVLPSLAGLGGFAYSLTEDPARPGRLALACGDPMLRVLDLPTKGQVGHTKLAAGRSRSAGRAHGGALPQALAAGRCLSQGLPGKVTSTAWHPVLPDVLACGSHTGHVLLVSPSTGGILPASIKHGAPVRQIAWVHGAQPPSACHGHQRPAG